MLNCQHVTIHFKHHVRVPSTMSMKIGRHTSPTVFFGHGSFNTLAGTVIVYTCSIIHHVWFFSMHEHYC